MSELLTVNAPPRVARIPLLVELCAGTAALSLRLEQAGARPPVSRMGAKTGYADAILALIGLEPGDKAERYLWCEPDAGVRLLLEAYRSASLAAEAAAIIRSWADEEPRALWDRLRAEGPPRCPEAREVARWAFVEGNRAPFGDVFMPAPKGIASECNASPKGIARVLDGDDSMRDRWACPAISASALPADVTEDGRTVDPREVARWLFMAGSAYVQGDPSTAYAGDPGANGGRMGDVRERVASRLLGGLTADLTEDGRTLQPPPLPSDAVCFIDPPYIGTTGYGHDLSRADVVAMAQRWAAAGATVLVSEAEPISALVEQGWHCVDITAMRVGQKRTFSKQQRECVTLNRDPAPQALTAIRWAQRQAEARAQHEQQATQVSMFPKSEDR